MNDDQYIIDKSDLRKWRTEIPNLYDDADLDPYEFRLLVHYVRVGTCWQSTKTTAEKCHMSTGQVSKKRHSLAAKGFITLARNEHDTYTIEIVDKWPENFAIYSCGEHRRSLHERYRSPHETKKEPNKKEPNTDEEKASSSSAGGKAPPAEPPPKAKTGSAKNNGKDPRVCPLLKAFAELLGYPLPNYGEEGAAAKKMLKNGYEPAEILACWQFMQKDNDFWKDKHCGLASVNKQIGKWRQDHGPNNAVKLRF